MLGDGCPASDGFNNEVDFLIYASEMLPYRFFTVPS